MQSFWWFRLWPRTSFIMSTAAFFKICNLNQIFKTYLNLKMYKLLNIHLSNAIINKLLCSGPWWRVCSPCGSAWVEAAQLRRRRPRGPGQVPERGTAGRFFYFLKLFCKRFLLAFLSPRASGRSWSSCRMSWEWPRHSTSASSEPLAPSSPSWLSSSRSSVALAKV